MSSSTPFALYIHYPFCLAKCPYCDFNSHVRDKVDHDRWYEAYIEELRYGAGLIPQGEVVSIFFGGGTPSLMPPALTAAIIEEAHKLWNVKENVEITLEANPTSSEKSKFKAFKDAGINRLSLGIQSLNPQDLAFLGRKHSADEARGAIAMAAEIFDNYSFDLIYARPKQQLREWEAELSEALTLAAKHLSLYQLTIEKGTPFYQAYAKHDFEMPGEELAHDFYQLTHAIMEAHGLPAYEISNHAQPGYECQHNLAYWRSLDYLGIGPGAHGRIRSGPVRESFMTIHHPENWLEKVQAHGHGLQQRDVLSQEERLDELLLMGLRLKEGLPLERIEEHLGVSADILFPQARRQLLRDEGLLESQPDILCLTRKGALVLNQVVTFLSTNASP
ncbi:MAG: coproporphyrinogen III oxidase [Alphaproteobacteria bacterium]|nr:coproporphyrinogen III oxidase [Alphaproteobacteria bacterium]